MAAVKRHGEVVAATDHGVTVSDETAAAWLASMTEKPRPVRKTTKKATTQKATTKKPEPPETPEGGDQ
jgi:topoisomerase IA-like protein